MSNPYKSGRLLELDVFRGIAALSVVFYHYTTRYDQLYGHIHPLIISFPFGHYGVQLFFMISGFVISMTLDNCRRPMDFVVSRFSRLYPAYWVAVCLTFVIVAMLGLPKREISNPLYLIVNFTMFQKLLNVPHVDGVYWTLQVELIFYICMFVFWKKGWLNRYHIVFSVWLGMRGIFLASELIFGIRLVPGLAKLLILPQIPYFCLGIAFYQISKAEGNVKWAISLIMLSLLLIYIGDGIMALFVSLVFGAFFLLAIFGKIRWLAAKPLLFFGGISYTLYLLHSNIGFAIIRQLQLNSVPPVFSIMAAFVVSIILAVALTYHVEKPAMQWIRKRYRNRMECAPTS